MEPIQVEQVVCDGFNIKFDSPIEFEVNQEEPNEDGFAWLIAYIEGMEGYTQCIGENLEDLGWHISETIVGTLMFPPTAESDEEYEMVYNYFKNSIESVSWVPPEGMEITIVNQSGEAELEFV